MRKIDICQFYLGHLPGTGFILYVPLSMEFQLEKYYYKGEDLFRRLSPQELNLLNQHLRTRSIRKNKILFRQGSFPAGMYILTKGRVKMFQVNSDEKETIIYFYTMGDLMGYRPMICHESHPLSCAALEDCTYSFLAREDFLKLLAKSPNLSNILLENLGHEFSVWVNSMSLFSTQSVKERIALAMLKLHEIYKPGDNGKVQINLSRGDLASYVGTAKETLVRVLADFKRRKMIDIQGRKLRILDREMLLEIIR
jgi:CRP-like cAMP-binding protein